MAIHLGILARKSHGQMSLASYSPWGQQESDTTASKQQQILSTLLGKQRGTHQAAVEWFNRGCA